MSFKFPFTTYHELNLDWILKKVETLSVNAEADANTIATYEERLQTAETQAQNAETSAANAQTAATSAASVAQNALTTANSAQSSADASGALASQAATKADAAQSAAESAQQAAETAQATAANFDGRITSAEQQASEALNMAQSFDEQARAAITTANNAANVATEAQATANTTALELARQRTALETIGSQQTAAINNAGAAQVTAINNAGQAVLDSLPSDYMNGVELVKDYTLGLYPQIEADYAPIVSFDNGADTIPVKDLKVNIIPYQSGTGDPSPSNIRPISGWTGVNITRAGKNLNNTDPRGGYINLNKIQAYSATPSEFYLLCFPCKPNTTYTVSFSKIVSRATIGYIIEEPATGVDVFSANSTTSQTRTIITGANAKYLVAYYWNTTADTGDPPSVQVELGSTATDYEPSTGSQISVTFPSSAGTVYGGTLSLNPDWTGTLIVDKKLNSYSGGWSIASNGVLYIDGSAVDGNTDITGINSNIYPTGSVIGGTDAAKLYPKTVCIQALNGLRFAIYDDAYTTAQAFNTYLSNNPLQIMYPLSTPVTFNLSTTEISGILSTFYGSNNVWCDAGNTAITYRADLGLFITENSIANYTKFAGMIAGVETGLTASKTYNTGDYFIVGQKLYKALTNIATGAAFTIGTNCEETTVGAELILAQ